MRKLLYPSLILNILLIGFFVGKRIYYYNPAPPPPAEKPAEMWNRGRCDVFTLTSIDSGDIVFVGNSISEGFPVSEIFGQHVKNRGISSNTSYHLKNRISFIAERFPSKIIIEIGVNDLRESIPPDSVMLNIREAIMNIKNAAPSTVIIINSVFPVTGDYFMIQPAIQQLNKLLSHYCKEQGLPYVDVYSSLIKGEQLDRSYTYDGIHLNAAGYLIWKNKLTPYIP